MSDYAILLSNALGSAMAGIVSRCCTHPLDTVKARLQAPSTASSYKGPIDVIIKSIQKEGSILGLYRGFGAVIIGGTPGTVMYLCTYEECKKYLSNATTSSRYDSTNNNNNNNEDEHFLIHFCCGMIAETVACIIYVPVDVVKERMQIQNRITSTTGTKIPSVYYRNTFDAISQISRTEGLAGIYKGYGATLASFGPYSALYFVFYEESKKRARSYLFNSTNNNILKQDLPFPWIVTCSAVSGALASWLTSPLDMAKLRLQVQRGSKASALSKVDNTAGQTVMYRGVIDCLQHSYSQAGVYGLFRGAGARVLHFAPATTVAMTTYETCRSYFARKLGVN